MSLVKKMLEELLLKNIKERLNDLELLLSEDYEEDCFYRFYHHSFKVYGLQNFTNKAVKIFEELSSDLPLNNMFMDLVKTGTNIQFQHSHNKDWEKHTKPILEAYFHSKHFLQMMIKYGKSLKEVPGILPPGWASILYLYNIR